MTSYAIIVGLAALLTALDILVHKIFKKRGSGRVEVFKHMTTRLKVIIRWNFFFLIFCTNYDGIVLYSGIEF